MAISEKPVTLDLWHTFSEAELREKGDELSASVVELDEVEAEKKTVSDTFKGRIDGIEGRMRILSSHIRAKGITQPTTCLVRFHQPRIAFKQTVRVDTGELVREEQMTPQECQENLFEARETDELKRMYDEPDNRNQASA